MPSIEHLGNDIWGKECTVCKLVFQVTASTWNDARDLMLEFFHEAYHRQSDNMVSRCKSCNSNKRHYRAMDKHRDEMLDEQDHKCALCLKPVSFPGRSAAVDHCHITGDTRKILCKRCNFLMAGVDDEEWLTKAILYRGSFRCE